MPDLASLISPAPYHIIAYVISFVSDRAYVDIISRYGTLLGTEFFQVSHLTLKNSTISKTY